MVQHIYLNLSINFSLPIFLYQACLSPSVSPSNLPSQADLCQTYLILLWLVSIPRHSEDRSIGVRPVLAFEQGLIYANPIERNYHSYTIDHMYHIHISFVSFDIWCNRIWNHWNVDGIWKRLKSVASITIRPFAKVLTAMSCRFYKRFPRVGTQASQVTQVDPAMISKYRLQETTLWNPWYLVVDVLISVSQKRAVYSWFQTSVYIYIYNCYR